MFVEDSNKEPKPTVEPVKQEISVVVPTPTPPIVAAGDVDTKLVELLERKINEANLPGPDYLELLQSAEQRNYWSGIINQELIASSISSLIVVRLSLHLK